MAFELSKAVYFGKCCGCNPGSSPGLYTGREKHSSHSSHPPPAIPHTAHSHAGIPRKMAVFAFHVPIYTTTVKLVHELKVFEALGRSTLYTGKDKFMCGHKFHMGNRTLWISCYIKCNLLFSILKAIQKLKNISHKAYCYLKDPTDFVTTPHWKYRPIITDVSVGLEHCPKGLNSYDKKFI